MNTQINSQRNDVLGGVSLSISDLYTARMWRSISRGLFVLVGISIMMMPVALKTDAVAENTMCLVAFAGVAVYGKLKSSSINRLALHSAKVAEDLLRAERAHGL